MSFTVGGSTPQLTFADATVQNTAALPLTGGSVSADITVNGLTVGRGAGAVATNTAVGASALAANMSGVYGNTAVGYQAGYSTTTGAIDAFGYQALSGNITGLYNAAFGYQSLATNTTGTFNAGFGRASLYLTTTGGYNSAHGVTALQNNTTGSNNTAQGALALYNNTTASNNTAVGYQAGYSHVSNGYSVYIGNNAGYLSTGQLNTFVGPASGNAFTTGIKNTVIGGFTGNQGGLDIRTASYNVVLSDGDGNVAGRWTNGGGWYQLNNSASWSTTSDARIKEKVETIVNGLDVVMALRPVEFDYKISQQHTAGFIAQEYETVLPDQIIEDANISDELKALTNGEPVKGIQQNLVPYLVSAIQALKAEFDAYKATHP